MPFNEVSVNVSVELHRFYSFVAWELVRINERQRFDMIYTYRNSFDCERKSNLLNIQMNFSSKEFKKLQLLKRGNWRRTLIKQNSRGLSPNLKGLLISISLAVNFCSVNVILKLPLNFLFNVIMLSLGMRGQSFHLTPTSDSISDAPIFQLQFQIPTRVL